MKSENPNNKVTKISFATGAIGKDIIANYIGMFYLFFLTVAVGLSPLIIGIAFFLAKIWDGINDPIMGAIVDNTRTKIGKYRLWIIIGSFLNAIVVIFMFYDITGSILMQYCFYILMYILWSMTYTLMDIPYWAMIPSLAKDEKERNVVSSIARVFTGLGTLIVAVGTPFILSNYYTKESKEGYLVIAVIFSLLFVIMMSVTGIFTKEKYKFEGSKVRLKEIFKTISSNDQLRAVLMTATLIFTAMIITSVIAPYYFAYVIEDFNLIAIFTIVLGAGYGGSMVLFPFLAKRFGRKNIFIFSCIFSMIGYIALFLVSTFVSEIKILLSFVALITFSGFGLIAVSITAMLADVVDYGEVKIGKRTDSIIFAMQSFMYKFAGALAALVTGIGLYFAGLNGIDPETDTGITLTDSGNLVIRIIMFIIPIVFLMIGLISYLRKYKLNGAYKEEILARLNALHSEEIKL